MTANRLSDVRPIWTNRPSVRAVWVATEESPKWIAEHTDALLRQLQTGFEVTSWANGLSVTEMAGGSLISAPDDWLAERVVGAMAETLSANGLDEVPH